MAKLTTKTLDGVRSDFALQSISELGQTQLNGRFNYQQQVKEIIEIKYCYLRKTHITSPLPIMDAKKKNM